MIFIQPEEDISMENMCFTVFYGICMLFHAHMNHFFSGKFFVTLNNQDNPSCQTRQVRAKMMKNVL